MFPNSVYLKPSVSLPEFKTMHQTVNYSRAGAGRARLEMLQRQFEHAGISAPLSRRKRTQAVVDGASPERDSRPGGWRSRSTAHDPVSWGSPVRLASLQAPREPGDSRAADAGNCAAPESGGAASAATSQSPPPPPPPPPIQQESFGSILNVLELRVAEAHAHREGGRHGIKPLHDVLEASSRAAAEACLLALRQMAAVQSPTLGPLLTRIADTLEPCLLSPEHCDEAGRPMTYEQVAKLVLEPMVRDERARVDEAEAARQTALEDSEAAHSHARELQRCMDDQQPKIRGLEGRYVALQMEAANTRREVSELQAENEELEAMAHGLQDTRVQQLQDEVRRLRDGEETARQREKELKIMLEGAVPLEDLAEAQARGDAAKADLNAAMLRVEALEKEITKLRTAVIISSATGASPLDALRRSTTSSTTAVATEDDAATDDAAASVPPALAARPVQPKPGGSATSPSQQPAGVTKQSGSKAPLPPSPVAPTLPLHATLAQT